MKKIIKNFSQIFDVSKWVFSIYWDISPKLLITYLVSDIILKFGVLLNSYVVALITDFAIKVYNQKTLDITSFSTFILIIVGIQVFLNIMRQLNLYSWRILDFTDGYHVKMLLHNRLRTLGIAQLENPEVVNKAQRFSEEINSVTDFMGFLSSLLSGAFTIIGIAVILLNNIPLVIPVFIVGVILQSLVNQNFLNQIWKLNKDNTEIRRKFMQTSNQLVDSAILKELIITDGYKYLNKQYGAYVVWITEIVTKLRRRWNLSMTFANSLDNVGYAFGLYLILKRLAAGVISVGQLTFEFRSMGMFSDSLSRLINDFVNLNEITVRLVDIREIFTHYKPELDGTMSMQKSKTAPLIEFQNVDFSYPGSEVKVFNNLSFSIKPGEKIAIVGENGAGKTTLIKLLARFYKANEGDVLIDETNLNDLKIDSWYKHIGILFQDFNTYSQLTLKENIHIGDIRKELNEDDIMDTLSKAQAMEFVEKYPSKLEQILGEKFKGGIRPSTGQWQKIAIARFFYRDAPVLILDEPTASIDAVAEAQIFDNIYKFIKNKTVIIVSHRFSTVRNADRIIVLDNGQIIEDGTHEELLAMNGKYANAFNLQAKGYV